MLQRDKNKWNVQRKERWALSTVSYFKQDISRHILLYPGALGLLSSRDELIYIIVQHAHAKPENHTHTQKQTLRCKDLLWKHPQPRRYFWLKQTFLKKAKNIYINAGQAPTLYIICLDSNWEICKKILIACLCGTLCRSDQISAV